MRKQTLHPITAIINNKQKIHAKKARCEALTWLAATFPQAFDNNTRIQPLKLGILQDILAHADKALACGISKSKLREGVVIFTRRIDYLTALKGREMRVDLNGNPTILVTEEEATHAAEKIKRRVEKTAKIARTSKAATPAAQKSPRSGNNSQGSPDFISCYPERAPAFAAQNSLLAPAKAATVIVKHKSTRSYDPSAVARLKEKLGLSRKITSEESVS